MLQSCAGTLAGLGNEKPMVRVGSIPELPVLCRRTDKFTFAHLKMDSAQTKTISPLNVGFFRRRQLLYSWYFNGGGSRFWVGLTL